MSGTMHRNRNNLSHRWRLCSNRQEAGVTETVADMTALVIIQLEAEAQLEMCITLFCQ